MERVSFVCVSVFFILLISTLTETLCLKPFHLGKCTCDRIPYYEDDGDVFVTNCTNSNFTSPEILSELPIDTEILIFTGNHLKELPKDLFGRVGVYDKLREIDFSRNHIEKIANGAFSVREKTVEKLILNDNKWKPDKGENIFRNLINLKQLHLVNAVQGDNRLEIISDLIESSAQSLARLQVLNLSHNFIKDFVDDSFLCDLPNLRKLDLTKNRLKSLKVTSRCTKQLSLLDLSHNKFTHLDDKTTSTFLELQDLQIRLNANPFHCDCNFKDVMIWMTKNTSVDFIDTDTYRCSTAFPESLVGKSITEIDWEGLECPVDYNSHTGLIVMSVVLVIVIGLIAGLVFINRKAVCGWLRRSTDPIWRKFEYSTINSRRDDAEVDV